ncbi:integrase arm-type DNA-binding domain-containing protein [Caballeronia sp. BR00000012568055]|uniref:tyrosine-type recombinase/integrase n=1 Tax=Caballeronia sp. BR00000012568055 TaxID=2918761 RepID=UPI0023F66E4D|nr:integrase arm-type DNA-binding domain-containing protein [Caballeronia sp. BR00000012568055]
MALTDIQVRAAEPREKQYRLADGMGMYLEVRPNGGKYWRLKYRFADKEKTYTIGPYPAVSLKEARSRRDDARTKLSNGIDPSAEKQSIKRTNRLNAENSFEAVSREWSAAFASTISDSHAHRNLRRLEVHVFPYIGVHPTVSLQPPVVLDVIKRIAAKGHLETAHRVRVLVGQVMRYAVSTGRATRDITADLRDALPPSPERQHAAVVDPKAVGALLRACDGYTGSATVTAALKIAPLVFQRPGELRQAEWTEIDMDAAMWTIPARRMKRRLAGKEYGPDHLVPLSRQAVELFRELHLQTGRWRYVFPSQRGVTRPMSDMALSAAFKRMGIDAETALPHGWRATARTLAVQELGVPAEVVERQLSHTVRDSLGTAYNRTTWLDARRDLMQRWADYLDKLKTVTTEAST